LYDIMTLIQELMQNTRLASIQIIEVNPRGALHQIIVASRCHDSISSGWL
jgi:hypothetical protein